MRNKTPKLLVCAILIFASSASFLIVPPKHTFAAAPEGLKKSACKDVRVKKSCEDGVDLGYDKSVAGATDENKVCGNKPKPVGKGGTGLTVEAADKRIGCVAGVAAGKTQGEKANQDKAEEKCKNKSGAKKESCIKGAKAALAGEKKEDACKDDANKSDCEDGFDLINSEDANDQPDCDTKLTSTLSWIICPLVDMGVGLTDYVFENFVQPFLDSVPVSTDTKSGTYKAWQQFRVIANVLLIGTLLVVVYSQIKGDR